MRPRTPRGAATHGTGRGSCQAIFNAGFQLLTYHLPLLISSRSRRCWRKHFLSSLRASVSESDCCENHINTAPRQEDEHGRDIRARLSAARARDTLGNSLATLMIVVVVVVGSFLRNACEGGIYELHVGWAIIYLVDMRRYPVTIDRWYLAASSS